MFIVVKANSFEWSGTWKLDGDKLIIKSADVTNTVETELSKGKTAFTFVDENGGVWHFKKIQ